MMLLILSLPTFLECLEKTILSLLRFLNLDSAVKAKLMEVTMLTLRLSVKHSIFAQLMELEVLPSTASSVLMEHSSTRTISSVIGGSTLTAPLQRIFTLSMMRLLLNVKLLLLMPLVHMRLLLTTPLLMLALGPMKKKVAEAEGSETGGTTDVEEDKEGVEVSEVELDTSRQRITTQN